MKELKNNPGSVLIMLLELVVGILLLIDPQKFTAAIVTLAGVILAVYGIVLIIRYFRSEAQAAARHYALAKGLVFAGGGLFCISRAAWFTQVFQVLALLYGLAVLLTGVVKIQMAVDMLRLGSRRWYFGALGALITVVFALIILLNPFEAMQVLWNFIGIVLIIEGVLDIVGMILIGTKKGA